MNQIWPTKMPDGTVYERHVYSGPDGDGFIDIFYREKPDGTFEMKQVHNGPEERQTDLDFNPIQTSDKDAKLRCISSGKADWVPDVGFKVKDEFKDVIDESGKDIIKEPKDGKKDA